MVTHTTSNDQDGGWRRPRSESSVDAESVHTTNAITSDSGYIQQSRRSSVSIIYLLSLYFEDIVYIHSFQTATARTDLGQPSCYGSVKSWCIAWWHSGRDYDEHYEQDEQSDIGYDIPHFIPNLYWCCIVYQSIV